MQQSTQIEIIRRLLGHLDRAEPFRSETTASVPASIYTSAEHLELEQRTILSTWPQLTALTLLSSGSSVIVPTR